METSNRSFYNVGPSSRPKRVPKSWKKAHVLCQSMFGLLTFALSVNLLASFYRRRDAFADTINDYQNGFITDIRLTQGNESCGYGYEELTLARFTGIDKGCLCSDGTLRRGSCMFGGSKFDTCSGDAVQRVNATSLPLIAYTQDGQARVDTFRVCAWRAVGQNMYTREVRDGGNSDVQARCPVRCSTSNYTVCMPEGQQCPINGIIDARAYAALSDSEKGKYEPVQRFAQGVDTTNTVFYVTRSSDDRAPLTELRLSEGDGFCVEDDEYQVSRQANYPLFVVPRSTECARDERYERAPSNFALSQIALYEQNDIWKRMRSLPYIDKFVNTESVLNLFTRSYAQLQQKEWDKLSQLFNYSTETDEDIASILWVNFFFALLYFCICIVATRLLEYLNKIPNLIMNTMSLVPEEDERVAYVDLLDATNTSSVVLILWDLFMIIVQAVLLSLVSDLNDKIMPITGNKNFDSHTLIVFNDFKDNFTNRVIDSQSVMIAFTVFNFLFPVYGSGLYACFKGLCCGESRSQNYEQRQHVRDIEMGASVHAPIASQEAYVAGQSSGAQHRTTQAYQDERRKAKDKRVQRYSGYSDDRRKRRQNYYAYTAADECCECAILWVDPLTGYWCFTFCWRDLAECWCAWMKAFWGCVIDVCKACCDRVQWSKMNCNCCSQDCGNCCTLCCECKDIFDCVRSCVKGGIDCGSHICGSSCVNCGNCDLSCGCNCSVDAKICEDLCKCCVEVIGKGLCELLSCIGELCSNF